MPADRATDELRRTADDRILGRRHDDRRCGSGAHRAHRRIVAYRRGHGHRRHGDERCPVRQPPGGAPAPGVAPPPVPPPWAPPGPDVADGVGFGFGFGFAVAVGTVVGGAVGRSVGRNVGRVVGRAVGVAVGDAGDVGIGCFGSPMCAGDGNCSIGVPDSAASIAVAVQRHRGRELRCVADEPRRDVVRRRSRLAGSRAAVGELRRRRGALADRRLQRVRRVGHDVGMEGVIGLGVCRVEHLAVPVGHLLDEVRRRVLALCRERRVGVGLLDRAQPFLEPTEEERGSGLVRIEVGRDAGLRSGLGDGVGTAGVDAERNEHGVDRMRGRGDEVDGTELLAAEVLEARAGERLR